MGDIALLADWSSIWAGFAVVWGAFLLYGLSLALRLWRARSGGPQRSDNR